jgi:alkylation response protein AidB-like acyl-CoA dehydrogenase
MTDVSIPHEAVLADPIGGYVKRIRSGFILLQTGMALGLIKSLIDLMRQMRETHHHINCYLPDQPEDIERDFESLRSTISSLAATPFEEDPAYFRNVIEVRLSASELSLTAANAAMLHQGARGYLTHGLAQRRLREAYFVAIVTPAIKQLRKMLNDFGTSSL